MHSCDTSKVLITSVLFFSLVGSLNKIPISVAGILLFNVPVSVENFCSIVFGKNLFHLCCFSDVLLPCYILTMTHFCMFSPGLFAGIFFAKAKCPKAVLSKCGCNMKMSCGSSAYQLYIDMKESILSRMPPRREFYILSLHAQGTGTAYVCMPSLSFVLP